MPTWANLDLHGYSNPNLFIDLNRKRLSTGGWNGNSKYFLLFDYEKGDLIDSIKLEFPFSHRFFYSPELETIMSYISEYTIGGDQEGFVYSINLNDRQVQIEKINSSECGAEHQGINNSDNLFYNYGCDRTSIYNLETKTTNVIDHYEFNPNEMSKWGLLYGIGLSKDHSYLLGFGLYQRHFPEDPDFTGTYDSIRDELYMVRKNLIDGSFTENQIDLKYGRNNGYFNSEIELYFLKHNEKVMVFNPDLTPYKTVDAENMSIIKQ